MRKAKIGKISKIRAVDHGLLKLRSLPVYGRLGRISIVHVRLPPHSRHPSIQHRKTDEVTCIISGQGVGVVGRKRIVLTAGDYIQIPAGSWHEFSTGRRGMEVIAVFAPKMDLRKPDVITRRSCP